MKNDTGYTGYDLLGDLFSQQEALEKGPTVPSQVSPSGRNNCSCLYG